MSETTTQDPKILASSEKSFNTNIAPRWTALVFVIANKTWCLLLIRSCHSLECSQLAGTCLLSISCSATCWSCQYRSAQFTLEMRGRVIVFTVLSIYFLMFSVSLCGMQFSCTLHDFVVLQELRFFFGYFSKFRSVFVLGILSLCTYSVKIVSL